MNYKNQLLIQETMGVQSLSENDLLFVCGGTAEGWGYTIGRSIGFAVGLVFGTVVNAINLFS